MAIVAVAGALVAAGPALASSEAAWQAFRHDVEQQCRGAAAARMQIERVTVDPWGSAHYGLARLTGIERESGMRREALCVYDKRSHRAELGSLMPPSKATHPRP